MNQRRNFRDLLHYPNQLDEWIRTETDVRLLQELKHNIAVQEYRQQHELIDIAIQILLAETAANSSLRLEKQTENLIRFAESSERSGRRMEKMTKQIETLTRALVLFTAVLVFLTLYLGYDACKQHKSENPMQQSSAK